MNAIRIVRQVLYGVIPVMVSWTVQVSETDQAQRRDGCANAVSWHRTEGIVRVIGRHASDIHGRGAHGIKEERGIGL